MFYPCIIIPILLISGSSGFNITYTSNPADLPYSNWMSYFHDINAGDLPMVPGSHDSATLAVSAQEDWLGIVGWLYAQTQSATIFNQLMMGVRFLDFRLAVVLDAFDRSNEIYLSHTFMSNTTLLQGLEAIKNFLDLNPSEFVYLLARVDTGNPLKTAVRQKVAFIESIFHQSGLNFANVSSLATTKVKELAGKVVLIGYTNQKLLPINTNIPLLNLTAMYSMCDIWEYSSFVTARSRIASCFPQVPAPMLETGLLTGYALDGQFDQLWPNITSPELNNWWITNFQNNSDWSTRKKYPIGVFLIDFVNATYMSVLLDFIMNFAYPYPYYGEAPEPWTPGANITVSNSFELDGQLIWPLALACIIQSIV